MMCEFSVGVGGAKGERNTPTLLNVGGRTSMFWDGRAETLEDQAIFPIENPIEMNLPIAEAVARLEASAEYKDLFAMAYEGKITPRTIGRALGAFQKTLQSFDTPYDSFNLGDDSAILRSPPSAADCCSSARRNAPIAIRATTSPRSGSATSDCSTAPS